MQKQPVTLKEAVKWASCYLNRIISASNISYLIQYGKIKRYGSNGSPLINLAELESYYQSLNGRRELTWKKKLGNDLNWALSFDHLREKDTTKHVHRLHPYKGKFIPQLVEYFIDAHIDDFKKEIYFKQGDIILDPFSGSGTTIVQANELGIHAIGIDISQFNCMITDVKLMNYDFDLLTKEIRKIQKSISNFEINSSVSDFEKILHDAVNEFNLEFFPTLNFKYNIQNGKIHEDKYAKQKEKMFLEKYNKLLQKYNIQLQQKSKKTFLDKWYIENIRKEIDYAFNLIKKIKRPEIKKAIAVILSRTIRSCRATTHSDLATLKYPQFSPYYCYKHKKICKPLFSIKYWFSRYANDTLNRLKEFQTLKTDAFYSAISADSTSVNIFSEVKKKNERFYALLSKKKIKGIFTSPPYVGQIDYHEQHAYAYDLFGFKRKDDLEIGPLYKGQGIEARKIYVENISKVLQNCKKYLAKDFDIFLVANDKHNLYPQIANKAGLKIINQFKRPVLNRTERDKSPYSEIIFHLKEE